MGERVSLADHLLARAVRAELERDQLRSELELAMAWGAEAAEGAWRFRLLLVVMRAGTEVAGRVGGDYGRGKVAALRALIRYSERLAATRAPWRDR